MPDEKTPIPLRASRKNEPITFPSPPPGINLMTPDEFLHSAPKRPLVSPAMADFIHQAITKALYAIGQYDPEPNIATMTYDEFEAFMARVWEDE